MLIRCPECGEMVELTYHQSEWWETHGLDCGPYEHWVQNWYECPRCNTAFTIDELTRLLKEPA